MVFAEIERNNPSSGGRAVDLNIRHLRHRVERIAHQFLFISMDIFQTQLSHVFHCRTQPHNSAGVGCARFKAPRRRRECRAFGQTDMFDH
ncbi:hypothetical protein SRABI106_02234 [Rahnella aquatilis]|nr:hypothetical protein SRABI106_02234 [Rahnella aquatilis]